jgi:hypothetical protein
MNAFLLPEKRQLYWNGRQMRVKIAFLKVELVENKKGEISFTLFAPNLP